MWRWLKNILTQPGIDPWPARGRIPRLELSPMAGADIGTCLELYRLNEPGRFPPNLIAEYQRTLEEGTAFLIARIDGVVVGSAGLMRFGSHLKRGIGLVFGL